MKTSAIVITVLVLLLIGGGIIYSLNGMGDSGNATTTPEVITPTPTPAPQAQQQAGAPQAVTSSAVSPSDTTAIVNGAVNPMGAFTSYSYEYGTTDTFGKKTANQTVGSGFVEIQAPGYITGLVKNTTYYARLVAENQYGKVSGNTVTFKTTEGNPAPQGSSPSSKTTAATGISRTTGNLNGEVTPNKNPSIYWFEYGKTAELGSVSAFTSAGDGTAKVPVSISLSDLDPQTTYYFRVNAQNQFGTTNGSILNFKTQGPAAATAPKVTSQNPTAISSSTAVLHGVVNPNAAETQYWFEYSTDTLLGSVLLNSTPEVTLASGANNVSVTANLSNLAPKTKYYMRLVAENSLGTVRGDEITFTTK